MDDKQLIRESAAAMVAAKLNLPRESAVRKRIEWVLAQIDERDKHEPLPADETVEVPAFWPVKEVR